MKLNHNSFVEQPKITRYEELASFIRMLVEQGTLAPGTRVPSLRRISRDRGVSLATALEAYRRLEDLGIIEARPRSGYFIARAAVQILEKPSASTPAECPVPIYVSDVLQQLLHVASDPGFAPLGCAVPSPEVLRSEKLDRILSRTARIRGAECNTYAPPQGDLRLRTELSRRALAWGLSIAPADITITAGCTEAIGLALGALCRAGDTVAVESPTYFGFLRLANILNLKVLELPTDPEIGVDPAAMRRLIERNRVAACLLSSSFSNPTGATVPEDRRREVVDSLAERGVPLVEDDTYGDAHFAEQRPRPFSAFDETGSVIYCSSFSKILAPGYRVGWIAAKRHMQSILDRKFATTLSNPTLAQAALGEFLGTGGYDNHLRRIRRTFADNVARARCAIGRYFPAGTKVSCPDGGFLLWLEFPQSIDTQTLLETALPEGICFAPGHLFSAQHGFTNCLRLSCGAEWTPNVENAFARLGAIVTDACSGTSSSTHPVP